MASIGILQKLQFFNVKVDMQIAYTILSVLSVRSASALLRHETKARTLKNAKQRDIAFFQGACLVIPNLHRVLHDIEDHRPFWSGPQQRVARQAIRVGVPALRRDLFFVQHFALIVQNKQRALKSNQLSGSEEERFATDTPAVTKENLVRAVKPL